MEGAGGIGITVVEGTRIWIVVLNFYPVPTSEAKEEKKGVELVVS